MRQPEADGKRKSSSFTNFLGDPSQLTFESVGSIAQRYYLVALMQLHNPGNCKRDESGLARCSSSLSEMRLCFTQSSCSSGVRDSAGVFFGNRFRTAVIDSSVWFTLQATYGGHQVRTFRLSP